MRFTILAIISVGALTAADVFPWPQDITEHHGVSRTELDAWRVRLAAVGTNALLVVRDDKIIYEWYAEGHGPDRKEGTASLAKAIVGGSSLMIAMHDGRLKVDDLASKYIPLWKADPQKSRIAIRHLATHTSGIEDAEQ